MKITFLTNGTRGDLEPLKILAQRLQQDGHDMTFAASSNFSDALKAFNLVETPLNLQDYLNSENGKKLMKGKNPLNYIIQIKRLIPTLAHDSLVAYHKAAKDSDLIITTTGAIGDVAISRRYKIPMIEIQLQPLEPTKEFPYPFVKLPFHNGYLNRVTYRLFESLLSSIFKKSIRKWQKDEFNQLFQKKGVFKERREHVLYKIGAYSQNLVQKPSDWSDKNIICGPITNNEIIEPDSILVDFIETGSAPLYIGFGSMVITNPHKLSMIINELIEQIDIRIIFCKGWSQIELENIPGRLLVVDRAPHNWLFPKTLGVIHHGGAGTTHAVLKTGVPQCIIPKTADQPFWADRVYKLGLSPRPIKDNKLDISYLKSVIEFFKEKENQTRAKEVSTVVEKERALDKIVDLIYTC